MPFVTMSTAMHTRQVRQKQQLNCAGSGPILYIYIVSKGWYMYPSVNGPHNSIQCPARTTIYLRHVSMQSAVTSYMLRPRGVSDVVP